MGGLDLMATKRHLQAESAAADVDPLVSREHAVEIRYTDPSAGILRTCTVISRVPDRGGKDLIARLEASLAGVSWMTLPPIQQGRFHALAVVAVQFVDPPKWLLEACGENDDLLAQVLSVLEGHATRYFRGDGETGPEDPQGRVLDVRLSGAGASISHG